MEEVTIIPILILAGCTVRWVKQRLGQRAGARVWDAFIRVDRHGL